LKNATKHAEELRPLLKRLLKDHKPEPMQKLDPLKALVRGAMSYNMPDSRADEAMARIEREFVDLNELRVATDLEIAELLGPRYPDIENRVEMITRVLNAIFEKEHTLNLERVATLGKRDMRQFLRDLPELHPFVEAYVMLMSFDGHCVPVDDQMLDYLRNEEVVEEKTELIDAQKFLEHHLKPDECYEFYVALRRAAAAEAEGGGKKKKSKASAR
jgi:endonuclease III